MGLNTEDKTKHLSCTLVIPVQYHPTAGTHVVRARVTSASLTAHTHTEEMQCKDGGQDYNKLTFQM